MKNRSNILTIDQEQGIAIVTLNNPGEKVNKLSEELIEEFSVTCDSLEQDPRVEGVLLMSGKEENFIAGADIGMFKARETAHELAELSRVGHQILLRVEHFAKPFVVAIHGSCMGGGTELALACHYRIVSDHPSTKIALPEVKLGLLPGMGGTQRLPALIGIQKSLPYLLTGRNIYPRQAKRNGFADEVVHRHGLKEAGIRAAKKLAGGTFVRKDRRSLAEKALEGNPATRALIFAQARKQTLAQTKGNYPAAMKIIDSVEYRYKHGFVKGMDNESKLFGELAVSPESRALVQLFFGMTHAKNNPMENRVRPVETIAVLGAGLMGAGIAEVSAEQGYRVWLKDQTADRALKGKAQIDENLLSKVEKRILNPMDRDRQLSRIHTTDSYDGFGRIDLVIEAVFEDLELKRSIVKEVQRESGSSTIFASNTSSLPISEIAAGARYPGNIIGMHYFSPVQKMPLLEIIKTPKTKQWVLATAYDVGVKQGKTVIVVNDGPGFYTTRILAPFMNEALLLLEEGASVEQLESTMKQFGFPVGPIALFDEVGIDVGAHVSEVLGALFRERGAKTSSKAAELAEAGYLGRKNGKGFYLYPSGKGKKKKVNRAIYSYFGGEKRKKFTPEEIQSRMALMMVNEAVLCLQEEILLSAGDGDLGAILGLGFPPFLGGPFRYIDREGAASVCSALEKLQSKHGDRFRPAEMLQEMASSGKAFYD
ncbi:MAG: fatty acid oxidation complex subunit alpha FadJ [Balneolaceae bacterium]|nr:MAG: fatty acid oxidation complex subunit alpha FadJ [Balneolaceae bacterium]